MGCAVSKRLQKKTKESSPAPMPDKLRPTISSLIIVPPTPTESSEPSQQQSTAIEDATAKNEEVEPVIMGTVLLEPERQWCLDKLDEWRMKLDQEPPSPTEWPQVRFIKPMTTVAGGADGDKPSSLAPVFSDKNAHIHWVKEDKERRKSIYVKKPSDDTVYAMPTQMPDISYTDYYEIPL